MFGALKWNNKFHNKKDLVKTEILLQQCSLALVGTINWTSQMLSIWLLLFEPLLWLVETGLCLWGKRLDKTSYQQQSFGTFQADC